MKANHHLALALALLTTAACGGGDAPPPTEPPPPPPAPTVSLSGTTFEVRGLGDSLLITASATPAGAALSWSIASPGIATISARGASAMVTAITGGTTTITAEATSGGRSATAAAAVTVVPIVRSVRVNASAAPLLVGATRPLTVVVQADAGASDSVRWISRTPARATVSATGTVTGVSAGDVVIVAESVVDAARRDSVTLQVNTPAVNTISITPTADTLLVGAFRDFVATVTADAGLSTAVTWTSSVPSVATVASSGRVTALASGSTTISARSIADSSRVAHASVTVRQPAAREVRITGATQLLAGTQAQLTAQVVADAGVSAAVTWSSSQPGVASIDGTGRVVAIGAGATRITARSVATPAVADSVILTVSGPPRFAAWETRMLDILGGQLAWGTATDLISLDLGALLVTYGGVEGTARTFYWRDTLYTIAPGIGVPAYVHDLSIASDGHVSGWNQSTRTPYRLEGSSFVALPPLPDGAVLQRAPKALPNGRVGAHGRLSGIDRAYVWTGTQWQERFRIAANITSGLFSHVVFFSNDDILYYEPKTLSDPRDHVLLRWRSGNTFDTLPKLVIEGTSFFAPQFTGRSSTDFFVAVTNSRPLRHFSGGAFSELTLGMDADESVAAVTVCPNRAVVRTNKNRVIAVDGTVGVPLGSATDFEQNTSHLSCAPDGTLRRAGSSGYVGRWTGTMWRTELFGPTISALRAVSATLAFAGTTAGAIHRWNGASWSEVYRPAPGANVGAIASIAAWPDGRAVATAALRSGGQAEVRLSSNGDGWSASPLNLTGVGALWGPSADEIWGLTTAGHIVRSRNGAAFEMMRADQRYIGIGGVPGGTMIAIGNKLETLRWTGTSWETVTGALPGVTFSNHTAIWSHVDAWAAAATAPGNWANVIHHFDGSTWQPINMSAIGGSSNNMATMALFTPGPGEVYALHGAYSLPTTLYHRVDGAWTGLRVLLDRPATTQFVLTSAAAGMALVVDDNTRLLMSRPGLTGASRAPAAAVRRRRDRE